MKKLMTLALVLSLGLAGVSAQTRPRSVSKFYRLGLVQLVPADAGYRFFQAAVDRLRP